VLNVLIVDDSIIVRKMLTLEMQRLGYYVVGQAGSGQQAIELYDEFVPDLVTMDITMSVMNGIEAVKVIKAKHKDAVIVMITSHGEEKMVMEAIMSGAKGYILKPISPQKITDIVNKIYPDLQETVQ
jgi:two-component system, chemotaxis family, chemotaxis protein CheY